MCNYTGPTHARITTPKENLFGGRGRPWPQKSIRRSLRVHSANKSKVCSPKQGLGKKRSQTQPVRTLGRRIQGTKPFWRPGPAWAPKRRLDAAACTFGHQLQRLQTETKPFWRPGPIWDQKATRRSLRVHSADKSKVYSPEQNHFWRPGPAWAQNGS